MTTKLSVNNDDSMQMSEQLANDIAEIYRILARVEKKQDVSDKELRDVKQKLESLVIWARQAGDKLDIPLGI